MAGFWHNLQEHRWLLAAFVTTLRLKSHRQSKVKYGVTRRSTNFIWAPLYSFTVLIGCRRHLFVTPCRQLSASRNKLRITKRIFTISKRFHRSKQKHYFRISSQKDIKNTANHQSSFKMCTALIFMTFYKFISWHCLFNKYLQWTVYVYNLVEK